MYLFKNKHLKKYCNTKNCRIIFSGTKKIQTSNTRTYYKYGNFNENVLLRFNEVNLILRESCKTVRIFLFI